MAGKTDALEMRTFYLPIKCCVKRVYLIVVILKFSGQGQVALLLSHMTKLNREDPLHLAQTADLGNATFQRLIMYYTLTN